MATKPPDAFLSYTRFDDRRGVISDFRKYLQEAVQEATGEAFEIFQDVNGTGIGEHWPDKLDDMLEVARFFIPIITPSYFKSEACRDELEKFLRAEAGRGRTDLVLPIYWIESDSLKDPDQRAADPLAATIHKRQHHDWCNLRLSSSFRNRTVQTALHKLAIEIVDARRRSMPRPKRSGAAPALTETDRAPTEAEVFGRPRVISLDPGTVFRDIDEPWCPEMVVIPPGEFMMGSTEAEKERPQHQVRIVYRLAVGRYPVTFEEYDHFAPPWEEPPSDEGWGRGRRPVINVSWDDAEAYVEWLGRETGQPYRLLSEAEWEHACRAGTTTRYSWGYEITAENANYGKNVGETSEVGSYPANPFGLYDMQGNVWEWVEDRWHDNYVGAPHDGSAWTEGKIPAG